MQCSRNMIRVALHGTHRPPTKADEESEEECDSTRSGEFDDFEDHTSAERCTNGYHDDSQSFH